MGKEIRPGRTAVDATLTSKGQLTLPAPVREAMGVVPGDKVRFAPSEGEGFLVTPVRRGDVLQLDGQAIVVAALEHARDLTDIDFVDAYVAEKAAGDGFAVASFDKALHKKLGTTIFPL